MANHISHASLPYPIKNARFTMLVPYLDADGDPTDPTTPDTEISQDGGAFADGAEEVTTITGSNGMGYVTLSGAETNNSAVGVAFKVASGPKATLATLYPRNLPILASGTASAGAAGSITLASSITYDITGCFVRTTGGTGGGGTGGANNQARRITAYNTSTQVATVTPNWETTPDSTTTYDVLCPEGITPQLLKALNPTSAGRTLDVSSGGEAGLDWANVGSPTTSVNLSATTVNLANTVTTLTNLPAITAGWLTATGIAADAITAAKIADGAIDAATFAAGAINAAAIAADAIGASELAADAASEIATAVTTALGTGTGLTAIPWNAAWDAEVQSEVQDAIEVNHLDHLIAVADPGAVVANNSFLAKLVSASVTATWSDYSNTDMSLQAIDNVLDPMDLAISTTGVAIQSNAIGSSQLATSAVDEIVDAVWDEATSGHVTAGTFGKAVGDILDDTGTSGVVLANDAITAAKIATDAITAAKIAADAIGASELATDAVTEIVTAVLTTVMTESYRGAGAAGTLAQYLHEIIAHLGESAISGTTKTLKKLDGSTTAKTYTLDSATTPTSITETT